MNTLIPLTRRWDYRSGVSECRDCEGAGFICKTPHYTHPHDPRRVDVECDHCGSVGHTACEVCGFDIVVPGYDCIVCQTVCDMPYHLLTDETARHFGEALAVAFKARAAVREGVAA